MFRSSLSLLGIIQFYEQFAEFHENCVNICRARFSIYVYILMPEIIYPELIKTFLYFSCLKI